MRHFFLVICLSILSSVSAQEAIGLDAYFPMKLFFANDEPNPRTNMPTTELTYSDSYKSYARQFQKYLVEGKQFNFLLEDDIKYNYEHLSPMKKMLLDSLNSGNRIVLTVKGFASPLHFSDYNINISKRRISSFINDLKSNSELEKFINQKHLILEELPFGEYSAHESVNDNLDSTHLSVHHIQASYERRVEVDLTQITSLKNPYLNSVTSFFDAGKIQSGDVVKQSFIIENLGVNDLDVNEVVVSCGCSVAEAQLMKLASGEKTTLDVEVDTAHLALGKQVKSITVVYNNGQMKRFVILIDIVN